MRKYRLTTRVVALLFVVVTALVFLVSRPFLQDAAAMFRLHAPPIILLGVMTALALGVGARIWKLLSLPAHVSESLDFEKRGTREILAGREFICLATLLGFGFIGYVVFFLSLLQLLRLPVLLFVLALLAVWSASPLEHLAEFAWSRLHREKDAPRKRRRIGNRFFYRAFIPTLMIALIVLGFLAALQPADQSDAMRYHLAAPEAYVKNGGWQVIPHSSFTNFPFTIEMLYAVPLAFGVPQGARLIHYMFFCLTVLLIYQLGKRIMGPRAGSLGAIIFAGTPFVPILSGWAFIEVALTAYQFAAVYVACLLEKHKEDRKKRSSYLRLLALLAGLCLGIKYTSVVFVFFLVCWLLYSFIANRREGRVEKADLKSALTVVFVFCLISFYLAFPGK